MVSRCCYGHYLYTGSSLGARLRAVLVTSPQGTEDYTVHVTRPLCPPKLWTLTATPGVLTPPFNPEHLNYTLMLPNASVDAVTFTDTYPMPTGAPQNPLFLRCCLRQAGTADRG